MFASEFSALWDRIPGMSDAPAKLNNQPRRKAVPQTDAQKIAKKIALEIPGGVVEARSGRCQIAQMMPTTRQDRIVPSEVCIPGKRYPRQPISSQRGARGMLTVSSVENRKRTPDVTKLAGDIRTLGRYAINGRIKAGGHARKPLTLAKLSRKNCFTELQPPSL